jgi:methylmalonyl-CoA mutase N-terminal domain/subunit
VEDEAEVPILRIDPALESQQVARVQAVRDGRDEAAAAASLSALTEAARGDANLMYPILDCARAQCSEGEIVRALREVFGSWQETPVF